MVSGRVFEGEMQHQRKQQGPKRVPLSHSITAKHWRLVRVCPAFQSLLKSPYRYQAYRASHGHLTRTYFNISLRENVLKALVRTTWRVTMPLSLCTTACIAWPTLGCRR